METRLQGQCMVDECMKKYGCGSAESKHCMANLAWLCVVENLPLHISTQPGFVRFIRKWEPWWPSILKQSMTTLVERQSLELREEIKMEMEEVPKKIHIAFTMDFWTSPMGESFLTMSMHWIAQDWHLNTHIFGMRSFPKDHIAMNISEKLMDLHLKFGLYPKSSNGRIAQCPDAVRLAKLMHFRLKPQLNKLVLTSDCGSNVLVGAKKTSFGSGIVVLEHSCPSCFEGAYDRGLFGTIDDIGMQILPQPEWWDWFKKT